MVPVLRRLIHVPSSTPLSQLVALQLVGANSLHKEADELPASQNGAAEGAQRHLVVLGGSVSCHSLMGFLVLPAYEGLYLSQPFSSLPGATTIESSLQKRKNQEPAPFINPRALTPVPPHVLNVGLKRTASERSLVAPETVRLP